MSIVMVKRKFKIYLENCLPICLILTVKITDIKQMGGIFYVKRIIKWFLHGTC